ncbi:ankyrin repeat protein [Thraustotheca clavata]|uniref:Ankyrin repeat protein n=1 Tax=Thraustotheca clavata TaxID=74557 RepID=A0A1V9ZDZ7_9STRA|nr:ankyrin repeat protein [Thraustotheca clavata]
MTAIMLAVKYGHADVAEYLLTKGPELATTGRTVLHDAARNGMDSTIEKLVLHGLSVTTQDKDSKRTPLHEAVLSGNLSTVQLLFDNCPKATINYQDTYGSTILHYAAKSGFLKMVLLLLNAGVDVSILDNAGQTAWRVALTQGFEHVAGEIRKRWSLTDQHEDADIAPDEIDEGNIVLTPMQRMVLAIEGPLSNFERLFDEGLNINDRDPDDGSTMLMKAAKKGFLTVVKFFMRHGANISLVDNRCRNALIHAAPHMDVAIYLLEQGADLLHQDDTGRTVIHEAAKFGYTFSEYIAVNEVFMDIKDSFGSTPLHDAAKVGSDIGAKKLLNVGAHVSCVDFDHRTPIHYCVQPNFTPSTLRVLIRAEEPAIFLRDKLGRTVMFSAIISGNIPCVELLHAHGMLLTEKDTQDITLLHAAIQAKQTQSIDYLLSKLPVAEWMYPLKGTQDTPLHLACRLGYDVAVDKMLQAGGATLNTKVNAQGDTPLETSARCGVVSSLKMFLHHGYDLTPIDKESGQSLLHLAAEVDSDALDPELIPLLTNSGVSIIAFDKKGWQPLHIASARTKGANVVRALLSNGAPVNTPSKTNMTPYHCAAQMGIGEIVAILKDNGGR